HTDAGSHRAIPIAFVRDRRAEDGHHRIADDLLDRAAVPLELVAQAGMIERKQPAHVLWIELLCLRGESNEVDEDDGDDLSFLAEGTLVGLQRACAGVAEASTLGVLLAAARAHHHRQSVRRAGLRSNPRVVLLTLDPTAPGPDVLVRRSVDAKQQTVPGEQV